MKIRLVVLKLIILITISCGWNAVLQIVAPLVTNESALIQMENSTDSSIWIHMVSYLGNFSWVVYVILAVLLFRKELVYIYNLIMSKFKEEDNYEEH